MSNPPATSPVHAPEPRRALPVQHLQSQTSVNQSHIATILDHSQPTTRCTTPRDLPARLLSPIRLAERHVRPPCSRPTSPAPPCSPTKRRRVNHARPPVRHRRHNNTDGFIPFSSGPVIFDELPWISLLDAPPLDPYNPCDLSQLQVEKHHSTSSSAGPIRRRKTSLRSAPFPTDTCLTTPELSPSLSEISPSPLDLPISSSLRRSLQDLDSPRTPPPRTSILPVAATFHNLMPVSFLHAEVGRQRWRNDLSLS